MIYSNVFASPETQYINTVSVVSSRLSPLMPTNHRAKPPWCSHHTALQSASRTSVRLLARSLPQLVIVKVKPTIQNWVIFPGKPRVKPHLMMYSG